MAHTLDPMNILIEAINPIYTGMTGLSKMGPSSAPIIKYSLGYYEELYKQAGRPFISTIDGQCLATCVCIINNDQACKIGKKWMKQLAMAAKVTVRSEIYHVC